MKRFLRITGIAIGAVLALTLIAGAVLVAWKPWAPEIVIAEPGDGGLRITDEGLVANYYPAQTSAPGIVVFGGSDGGLSAAVDGTARALHEDGFSVLAISYWGAPGQEPRMENLPLEYFDTAVSWLQDQPEVAPDAIGVFGGSKGGEAALLVASRNPAVTAVVANVPSHVAWAGIDSAEFWRMGNIGSTWSADGQPVPYVPYANSARTRDIFELYRTSLAENPAAVEKARIRVDRTAAPIMMVCGEADNLWPSCQMAREVERFARANGKTDVTLLAYPEAGHLVQGPPAQPDSEEYANLDYGGGTVAGTQAARKDSWPQVLKFLHRELDEG